MQGDFGRLAGAGVTSPARARYLLTVAAGHLHLVVVLQVPGDGLRAGARALSGKVLAQPDDQVGRVVADRGRGGLRPPGPRLERRLALGLVAGQQRAGPGPGSPVSPRDLADRALPGSDGGDDQPGL
jgi:hypothetical protein